MIRQTLLALALLALPCGAAFLPTGTKVVSQTFSLSQYVSKSGCAPNKTIADGVADFRGTSGVRATKTESSGASVVTETGSACDPYEGTGSVPLTINLYGLVTYTNPSPESGMEYAQMWRVAAGYTLDVTYHPTGGGSSTYTFSAPTEVFPETWSASLPQYNGNLASVDFSLVIDGDLTNGCENISTNGGCYPTWQLVTGNYQIAVTR